MDAVEHDLTPEQWAWLLTEWGGCAYCGLDNDTSSQDTTAAGSGLQRDCVLAISRGGRYTVTNVVPACRSCNASKCNIEVTSWLRRKRLDERAFLVRLAEIHVAARARFPADSAAHDGAAPR